MSVAVAVAVCVFVIVSGCVCACVCVRAGACDKSVAVLVFCLRLWPCESGWLEETGTWSEPLTCGLISIIAKGEGSAPQIMRPIGLMASAYRLWASLRIRDIVHYRSLAKGSLSEFETLETHGWRPVAFAELDVSVALSCEWWGDV